MIISFAPPSPVFALFDMLGGSELLVVFLLVLVFFGGEKMPEFARGLAKVMREFRKAASGVEEEFKRAMEEEPPKPPAPYPPTVPPTPSIMPPASDATSELDPSDTPDYTGEDPVPATADEEPDFERPVPVEYVPASPALPTAPPATERGAASPDAAATPPAPPAAPATPATPPPPAGPDQHAP